MLVFFDIDATMITTKGSGVAAMADAGRELFTPGFSVDGVEFAGGLDPLLVEALLRRNGVEPSPGAVARFRGTFRAHLERRLVENRSRCRALPGVMELLALLRGEDPPRRASSASSGTRPRPMLGLLTGNYAETGSMKLRACGIEPEWFRVQVWGDESPHTPPCRDHLPGVGLERYARLTGRRLEGREAVVIGDTPHDVSCARAHGCRSLGVATGSFTVEQLERCGADWAVPDLSETGRVLEWLTKP